MITPYVPSRHATLKTIQQYLKGLIGVGAFGIVQFWLINVIVLVVSTHSKSLDGSIIALVLILLGLGITTYIAYVITGFDKSIIIYPAYLYTVFPFLTHAIPGDYFIPRISYMLTLTQSQQATVFQLLTGSTVYILPFVLIKARKSYMDWKAGTLSTRPLRIQLIIAVLLVGLFLVSSVSGKTFTQEQARLENLFPVPSSGGIDTVYSNHDISTISYEDPKYIGYYEFNITFSGEEFVDSLKVIPLSVSKINKVMEVCGNNTSYLEQRQDYTYSRLDDNFSYSTAIFNFKSRNLPPANVISYRESDYPEVDRRLYRQCFVINNFKYELSRQVDVANEIPSKYSIENTINAIRNGKILAYGCRTRTLLSSTEPPQRCTKEDIANFNALP